MFMLGHDSTIDSFRDARQLQTSESFAALPVLVSITTLASHEDKYSNPDDQTI